MSTANYQFAEVAILGSSAGLKSGVSRYVQACDCKGFPARLETQIRIM
jgi:hypothetical protein